MPYLNRFHRSNRYLLIRRMLWLKKSTRLLVILHIQTSFFRIRQYSGFKRNKINTLWQALKLWHEWHPVGIKAREVRIGSRHSLKSLIVLERITGNYGETVAAFSSNLLLSFLSYASWLFSSPVACFPNTKEISLDFRRQRYLWKAVFVVTTWQRLFNLTDTLLLKGKEWTFKKNW